jgi:hypothetical protein
MKCWWTTTLLAAVVWTTSLSTAAAAADDDAPVCRLWMAPSNLQSSSVSKFGLYAGVAFDEDERLPFPEIALPFVDYFMEPSKAISPFRRNLLEWLEAQFWLADYAGSKLEGNHSATTFVPGLGALANYHSGVHNVEFDQGSVWLRQRETFTTAGQAHPSRGGISHLHNLTMRATSSIPMGMELFANYGDVWDAADVSIFQDKLVRQDFTDADLLLDRITTYLDQFPDMSDSLKADSLDFMLRKVLDQAGGFRSKAIQSLLPNSVERLAEVQQAGGSFLYRNADMVKTPQWLKKNGLCVDNLEVKPSTIPAAGRGAFARRPLANGTVISPIPTTLIGDESSLNMYDVVPTEGGTDEYERPIPPGFAYNYEKHRGQQIALNYVYGHPESSLVLLPNAPMVNYINHGKKPNAELRWAEHEKLVNDASAHMYTVEDVVNHRNAFIVLELVATRDIAVGEEVLIDYGPEWIEAWEEYSKAWKKGSWPLKAEDLREVFRTKAYPAKVTVSNNPYPPGVSTACFITLGSVPDGEEHYSEDGEDIYWWEGDMADVKGSELVYCDILAKTDLPEGGWEYTVRTRFADQTFYVVEHVPHAAVSIQDTAYSSDIHHPDAFRHPIGIPDSLWPQVWRDLR